MSLWWCLCPDIQYHVLEWLNVRSLLRLRACSTHTRKLFENPRAWSTVAFEHLPFTPSLVTTHTTHLSVLEDCPLASNGVEVQLACVSRCSQLETLDFDRADLSVPPPPTLKTLRINRIHNLSWFSPCQGLKNLRITLSDERYLSQTRDTQDLNFLKAFPSLKTLYLVAFSVDNLEPLTRLPNLKNLFLEYRRLSDITPLARCEQLRSLCLDCHNRHSGTYNARCPGVRDFSPLAGCSELLGLTIRDSPFQDLGFVRHCQRLQYLRLWDCHSLEDLSPLSGCPHLEVLRLRRCKVSDVSPLLECRALKYVKLDTNNLLRRHVRVLDRHPTLESVDFHDIYENLRESWTEPNTIN